MILLERLGSKSSSSLHKINAKLFIRAGDWLLSKPDRNPLDIDLLSVLEAEAVLNTNLKQSND